MVKSKRSEQKGVDRVEDKNSLTVRDRMFLLIAIIIILGLLILFSQKSETSTRFSHPDDASEYGADLDVGSNVEQRPDIGITIFTDKKVYHSKEKMNITVIIETSEDLPNPTVHLFGIDSRKGQKLEKTGDVDLKAGTTVIPFEYTTPSCYGCAGINEGTYNINVELMNDNETLANATVEIEILK